MAAAYTLKCLTDVKDSAPEFGVTEHQELRFATADLDSEQIGVSHCRVKPGMRQGFAHRHEAAEEVYVVIAGSGRAKVGDDIVEVAARDALRISATTPRQFEAGPDGLELIAFGPRHEGDGELVPDGWSDDA
jgi:mannose-6-phosphate isomerase-like protein (cupin superfamily)